MLKKIYSSVLVDYMVDILCGFRSFRGSLRVTLQSWIWLGTVWKEELVIRILVSFNQMQFDWLLI